jgi:replicative DNA helicase
MNTSNIQVLLDSGFNRGWIEGNNTGSEVIFNGIDKQVYVWILDYHRKHRRVPPMQIFRDQFPEESYRISSETISLEELSELVSAKVNSYLIAELVGQVIDLHDKDKIDDAISLLRYESSRLSEGIKTRKRQADRISDFDLEKLLSTKLELGVPFGVSRVDDALYGFQPGQLISLMGRQKAGKSWLTLNSALNAWKEGYTVLIFSVEMDTEILRQRLLSLGSHVSPSRMRRGTLGSSDKEKVRKFSKELEDAEEDEGRFFISKKKSLITLDDIIEDVNQYNPNVVYIDGFSFMVDRRTGKMTDDWQANENVSAELKALAMEEEIVVFVNTQVQEKQHHARFGIEARTIAGGTGLLKASDIVIGLDVDNKTRERTISCVLSRFENFDNVVLEIDWDNMEFTLVEPGEKLKEIGV